MRADAQGTLAIDLYAVFSQFPLCLFHGFVVGRIRWLHQGYDAPLSDSFLNVIGTRERLRKHKAGICLRVVRSQGQPSLKRLYGLIVLATKSLDSSKSNERPRVPGEQVDCSLICICRFLQISLALKNKPKPVIRLSPFRRKVCRRAIGFLRSSVVRRFGKRMGLSFPK